MGVLAFIRVKHGIYILLSVFFYPYIRLLTDGLVSLMGMIQFVCLNDTHHFRGLTYNLHV